MTRVAVEGAVIRWARERAGMALDVLLPKFPGLPEWEAGTKRPTLKQLERYARVTHIPIGYLFLPKPLQEEIPIPDFRTMADRGAGRPSPDLLDTIYLCQQRQEWFRDWARRNSEPTVAAARGGRIGDDVVATAERLRSVLGLDLERRRTIPTWTDALRDFITRTDGAGIMVMVSGVVASNNRRKLDPREFRGFALVDEHAPLIFINGADSKAAQMFTLAHEIAHVWTGQTGLSDVGQVLPPQAGVEAWCNRVAAELLVPAELFAADVSLEAPLIAELDRLARKFKVSTLVILRRMQDLGMLTGERYWDAYESELERVSSLGGGKGGDFYLTFPVRASRRFARAVVSSALEGQSSYSEAFQLLGVRSLSTFHELESSFGLRV